MYHEHILRTVLYIYYYEHVFRVQLCTRAGLNNHVDGEHNSSLFTLVIHSPSDGSTEFQYILFTLVMQCLPGGSTNFKYKLHSTKAY